MKIGVLGTIWLNTPPNGYGGTEEVVYNLVNGLVKNGHDVTLFGPATANVNAKVFPTVKQPLRSLNVSWENIEYTLNHVTDFFDRSNNFDMLHVHLNKSQDFFSLPLSILQTTPTLFTFHFKLPKKEERPDKYAVLTKYRYLPFTSISDSQRSDIPLRFIKTVYNSLRIPEYPFNNTPKDYFVWLGKVNPLKGTKEAILAAKKAGVTLYVLGAVDKGAPEMLNYYEQEIKPLLDGKQIIWVGETSMKAKAKYLGEAKAFLNPILWEEPFGLVMAEAQATGTPVISFRRGAAPEVIVDGKTGFLVDTLDQMVQKIQDIKSIDRNACRKNIEEKFSVEKMVKGYEEAYSMTIQNWKTYVSEQHASIATTL